MTVTEVTAKLVGPDLRPTFLETMLPGMGITFEARCFGTLGGFTREYLGGYWDFYTLSNGGFYMAPAGYEEGFDLKVPTNYFTGHFSADAAGLVASLYALNGLCWVEGAPTAHSELFHKLRDYVGGHPEGSNIMGAID